MWKAAECRGLSYLWTLLALLWLAPEQPGMDCLPPLGEWLVSVDEHAASPLIVPTLPSPDLEGVQASLGARSCSRQYR
ncbi:MAG: hypothetical protein KatS3mg111_3965 [Pirellulaceae bacterium]|nr:MAG: hypothetical protein KatS3mg111_3965 [Pirellulaceae bacterium]